jgi:sugar phosphate isomerase/epimerase
MGMRLGLSVYGTTYAMGISSASVRSPVHPRQVIDRATGAGLEGVEIPVFLLQEDNIDDTARYAAEHGMFVTLAANGFDPGKLALAIRMAERLGAATVRTMIGGAKLGGDRRGMVGRWQPFLQQVREGLTEAAKAAERAKVNLAVENHQDLASEELLWICETIGSPYMGITLDTGNPLATAEEPLDFFRRVAPYVKNVHLKDYWLFPTEEGYRLVRCPLGQGAIDFAGLFLILGAHCPHVTMSIELGALEARHVRVLADDYWPEYPARTAAQLARVMRFVGEHARTSRTSVDWQTPFERGESVDAIIAYEERELAESLAYIIPAFQQGRMS